VYLIVWHQERSGRDSLVIFIISQFHLSHLWFDKQEELISTPVYVNYQYRQVSFYARDMYLKNIEQIKIAQIEHKVSI
jgi:hypothetical protein